MPGMSDYQPASPPAAPPRCRRFGQVLRVRREQIEEYVRQHAKVWPEVLAALRRVHVRNYSIFLLDDLLFGYFEYTGEDFAADMARLAADAKTQEWWAVMEPMQIALPERAPGEWWATMREVFHMD